MKSGRRWIYRKKRTVKREEMAHRWNSTRKSGDAAQECKFWRSGAGSGPACPC